MRYSASTRRTASAGVARGTGQATLIVPHSDGTGEIDMVGGA
jgi:hypothetical protein